jgi:hypothetical protein
MPIADLDDSEKDIIRDCLRAVVSGTLFPIWKFKTLFGLAQQEVASMAYGGVVLDDNHEDVHLAINNVLNLLAGDRLRCGRDIWGHFISVPPEEVRRILTKWKGTPAPT